MTETRIMCWPVDEKKRKAIADQVGMPVPMYRDSIQDKCSVCGLEVWLGPRQQTMLVTGAPVVCVYCVLADAQVTEEPPLLVHLGNTENVAK